MYKYVVVCVDVEGREVVVSIWRLALAGGESRRNAKKPEMGEMSRTKGTKERRETIKRGAPDWDAKTGSQASQTRQPRHGRPGHGTRRKRNDARTKPARLAPQSPPVPVPDQRPSDGPAVYH